MYVCVCVCVCAYYLQCENVCGHDQMIVHTDSPLLCIMKLHDFTGVLLELSIIASLWHTGVVL